MTANSPHRATLIPGDGIGPSIAESAVSVIEAAGVDIVWDVQQAGMTSVEGGGDSVPKALIDSIRDTRVALKSPITTPIGEGFRSVNVALRQEFDLYANLRPCVSLQGIRSARPGVDIVIVRENTEGMYAGQELYTGTDKSSAVLVAFNTRKAMLRICRYAFEYARRNNRKKVTAVHKANIMKKFSGILLTCFREVAEEYPEITREERIIDATAMEMVRRPYIFDVIVTTNLFGDILSDLVAGLVGGLGVAPGGNYGDDYAVFEAVHGSAPDIAGKNLANPLGLLLSANLMLRHIGEEKAALKIERAVREVLSESKYLTPDLLPGSKYGTTDMTKALVDKLVG
ncbi:MAG TPA: isocitrate/isopropylmalate family dehydrogenase [bacterium]|jgi:isocitrate dehydrogenase (NAD+)